MCQDFHCFLEDRVLQKKQKKSNFHDEITRHWQLKGSTESKLKLYNKCYLKNRRSFFRILEVPVSQINVFFWILLQINDPPSLREKFRSYHLLCYLTLFQVLLFITVFLILSLLFRQINSEKFHFLSFCIINHKKGGEAIIPAFAKAIVYSETNFVY